MVRVAHCLIIVLFIMLAAPVYSAAPVSWLDKTLPQLKSSVPASAWQSVSIAAGCYKSAVSPVSKKPFEIPYIVEMMQQRSFDSKCFSLLDDAMKREKELEKGHSTLDKETSLSAGHAVRKEAWQDYRFVKCRLRIMTALAKAGIAKRMAESGGLSYACQAMESAIDALKEAAEYADSSSTRSRCLGSPNPSSERIKLLRSRLLSIWDKSQRQADVKPLIEMDLKSLTEELMESPKTKNDTGQSEDRPVAMINR